MLLGPTRTSTSSFVPDRARWGAIQKRATNIGETLNKACAALEEQNSALEGVLAGIDYNDERKLGDARNRDTVLARLVQHFSQISLRNDRMAEPDILGRTYEYLIEQFADDAGKKGGEFYTPRMVVRLIVELLAPTERMRICDPTAGSGGMLIECAHYIERKGGNPRNLTLHGQEKNLGTWAICKMNMLLHGLPDARIEKGDTIRDPKLVDERELLLYDRVIANPPFSLDEWGRDVAENDGYPKSRADRGLPRRLPPEVAELLVSLKTEQSALSVKSLIGAARERGVDHPLAPSTVHRLLSREGLLDKHSGDPTPADRRRFAFRDAGELWMSDVMHGPKVSDGRRRRKTFLIAFIDDATRVLPFPNPERADSVRDLRRILAHPTGKTVMTTIQKFQEITGAGSAARRGSVHPTLSEAANIFVMVDEAHRTQYRSLAANMRQALPNACFLGFTGTPIDKKDRSTLRTFGPYIDTYTIEQAVQDGATVPIFYESRLPELHIIG